MNEHQATALAHPCPLPEETAHPRYAYRGGTHSVVLTVNNGFE